MRFVKQIGFKKFSKNSLGPKKNISRSRKTNVAPENSKTTRKPKKSANFKDFVSLNFAKVSRH